MKKNPLKIWIGCGIFCVLSVVLSSWYAVTYNDSRLVVPMDAGSYTFQIKDLPMILSVSLFCIYIFALVIGIMVCAGKRQKNMLKTNTTRNISPKLSFLGLFGFLGFAGFLTYPIDGTVFPFMFFLFFGFFGFFYEGKMSGTFMDERFRENTVRAQLTAYKTTFVITFLALILLCRGKLFGSLEYTLIAVIIVLSLALACGLFLSEYLLYRYDHDDLTEESRE